MKIDYELVEKIGATHYNTSNGSLYKVDKAHLLVYRTGDWERSGLTKADIVTLLKPITPKPQVRIAYERVKYSKVSDAISAHESGVKFKRELPDGDFTDYLSWFELCECYANNYKIVVEIEKPVDWQSDVVDYIYGNYNPTNHDTLSESLVTAISSGIDFKYLTQDEFLEMCRVALRANGEL